MPAEPLTNSYLTWIVSGALIFFILSLWGISRWAVAQILLKISDGTEKLEGITKVVGDLSLTVKGLTEELKSVRSKQVEDDAEKIRERNYMYDEIEMLRDSRHALFTFLTSIRSVLEATFKDGPYRIKFEGLWFMPKMRRESRDNRD